MALPGNMTDNDNLEVTKFKQHYLPSFIMLIIFCVIGVFGNAHAFFIYFFRYKPITCRLLVLWLSFVDIIVCSLCIVFEIVIMRWNMSFTCDICCKIFRFISQALLFSSVVILGIIAVHRKRKLGDPHGKQFSFKEINTFCACALVGSVAISIPSLYFSTTNIIPPYQGHLCTIGVLHFKTIGFQIYTALQLLALIVLFIIIYMAYSKVLIAVNNQICQRNQQLNTKGKDFANNSKAEDTQGQGNEFVDILRYSRKLICIFICITSFSFVGYLSYSIITLIGVINLSFYQSNGTLTAILFRGLYLNSAINPVVYLFLDSKFRAEVKNIYRRLFSTVLCREQKSVEISS